MISTPDQVDAFFSLDTPAFQQLLRKKARELRQRNPSLMRRLARMTDDELNRFELALLEKAEQTPERDYRRQLLTTLQEWRAPRPIQRRRFRDPELIPAPLESPRMHRDEGQLVRTSRT